MTTPDTPQVPQQTAPVSPPYAPAPPIPAKRRRWPWIAAPAAIALALAGGIAYAAMPSTADEAIEFCQEQARGKLKSPATAKFSDVALDHDESSPVYRVSGSVDAQNGFGALVREQFQCTLTHEKDGTWVPTNVDVG